MNIPAESNLLSIAENIKHQTAALIQQLKSNSFTEPSLDAGCTTELWTTDRLELIASKNSIVALNKELIRLIGGPKSVLWDVGIHYDFAALNVILEFDVLENLPIDGEVHVSQLAEQSGLDEDKLLRLLRLLSCEQVVEEVSIAVFRHTAISMFLVKDKAMKALVGMQLGEALVASSRLADTLKENSHDLRTGESAFKFAWGESPYLWYAKHPMKAKRFALAMEGNTHWKTNEDTCGLLRTWFMQNKGTHRNLVVDVGGGSGHISMSLAKSFPDLSFLVQDLSQTMFQRTCHSLGPDLQSRFKFQQHDFFLPQPIKPDAEVKAYILRYVLWNWSDDDCIRILQSFVPVLRNSLETVLLINDGFCPVPGSFEPHVEKGSRQLDIAMMVMFNSKSRMEYQWKELLAKTSVNLKESTISELHDERY